MQHKAKLVHGSNLVHGNNVVCKTRSKAAAVVGHSLGNPSIRLMVLRDMAVETHVDPDTLQRIRMALLHPETWDELYATKVSPPATPFEEDGRASQPAQKATQSSSHADIETSLHEHRVVPTSRRRHPMHYRQLLLELPFQLRQQTINSMFNGKPISSVSFFAGRDWTFFEALVPSLKLMVAEPLKLVYIQGGHADAMYFVGERCPGESDDHPYLCICDLCFVILCFVTCDLCSTL